jgi:hypothetical protein
MKKPVIANIARPEGFKDDAAEQLLKGARKAAKGAKKPAGRVAKKGKDVADPKYTKNPYNKRGGLKKDYKDYVMRESGGMF